LEDREGGGMDAGRNEKGGSRKRVLEGWKQELKTNMEGGWRSWDGKRKEEEVFGGFGCWRAADNGMSA
jgi:hypothetical protein